MDARKKVRKLHQAIFNADVAGVSRLIAGGACVNVTYKGETAFSLAAAVTIVDERHHADAERQSVRRLIARVVFNSPGLNPRARNKTRRRTALHEAISLGEAQWVSRLLEMGAHVDKCDVAGVTPLAIAAGGNKPECLQSLILYGANVNLRGKGGATPLHLACRKMAPAAVRVLLRHGCDVNARDDAGETALAAAFPPRGRNYNLPDLIRQAEIYEAVGHYSGLDLSARDRVVDSNNIYGLAFLAESGCDVGLRDPHGQTPFQRAISLGCDHFELARHLLLYGASGDAEVNNGTMVFSPIYQVMESLKTLRARNAAHFLTSSRQLLETLLDCTSPTLNEIVQSVIFDDDDDDENDDNFCRVQETVRELNSCMLQLCSSPRSLQHQTKLRIRRALGSSGFLSKLDRLPLPKGVKRFLSLASGPEPSALCHTSRLHAAVINNDTERAREAMERGGSPRDTIGGKSALLLALEKKNNDDVVSAIFSHLSATVGSSRSRSRNLDKGSRWFKDHQILEDVCFSDEGNTSLHLVAHTGRAEFVDAAVDLCSEQLYARNTLGLNALKVALSRGLTSRHLSTAEAIVVRGATELGLSLKGDHSPKSTSNLTLSDMGVTLLHLASAVGASRLVGDILSCSTTAVCSKDIFGYTPLQLATNKGQPYEHDDRADDNPGLRNCIRFLSETHSPVGEHDAVVRTLLAYSDV